MSAVSKPTLVVEPRENAETLLRQAQQRVAELEQERALLVNVKIAADEALQMKFYRGGGHLARALCAYRDWKEKRGAA